MTGPYYSDGRITVHAGDCLDVLPTLPGASIDAVVTDPPYGLEFMGKEWDRFAGKVSDRDFKGFVLSQQRTRNVKCPDCQKWAYDHAGRLCECGGVRRAQGTAFQAWCELWAAECLRVLKPGGHLLAFGGTRTSHRLACAIEDAGFEIRDSIAWLHGQGFPKGKVQLKPAHEPIVVVRRPGKSVLNIDACRVGVDGGTRAVNRALKANGLTNRYEEGNTGKRNDIEAIAAGRWPANVVLDESQAEALDEMIGERPGAVSNGSKTGQGLNGSGTFQIHERPQRLGRGDSGGPSRFFYVAKADSAERPRVNGTAHPTVKPLALMRWLVRLVTPPGGLVLDPFAGSGATVEACRLEGFRCIAIEREADYLPLITSRLNQGVLDFGPTA